MNKNKIIDNNNFRNNQNYFSSKLMEKKFLADNYSSNFKRKIKKIILFINIFILNLFLLFYFNKINLFLFFLIFFIWNILFFLFNYFLKFSYKNVFRFNLLVLKNNYQNNSLSAIIFSIITIYFIIDFIIDISIKVLFDINNLTLEWLAIIFNWFIFALFIWNFWPILVIIFFRSSRYNRLWERENSNIKKFYYYQWIIIRTFFLLLFNSMKTLIFFLIKIIDYLYNII